MKFASPEPLATAPKIATQRVREPEWMDQPDLDPVLHRQALMGLARLNRISRSAAILWKPIREIARQCAPQPCRILDLACGGGDVVCALARRARREHLELDIEGIDLRPVAVDFARQQAHRAGLENVRFHVGDVLTPPSGATHDVVMCSLFLHHLDEEDAISLLKNMSHAARRCVLVNDLRRTRFGTWLIAAGCYLLSRSPVVHVDGPLSARASWSAAELRELAERAGLTTARVSIHHPQRMLLVWSQP